MGQGTQPYVTSVSNPLNYGAKVMYDSAMGLNYFIGMAIEWLDRWGLLHKTFCLAQSFGLVACRTLPCIALVARWPIAE